MKQKPLPKKAPLLDKEMKSIIFAVSLISGFILYGLYLWLTKNPSQYDLSYIRTMIFAGLGIDSLFFVFSCKSLRHPVWKINFLSNLYLIGSVIFGFLLLISAIYVPFLQKLLRTVPLRHLSDWLIVAAIGFSDIIIIEIIKAIYIAKNKK